MAMRMHVTSRKQLRTLRRRRLAVALAGALAVPVAPAALAQSLPDAGSVTSGSATINQAGTQMTITQTSQGAIIDWGSFNIDPGYGVIFDQQFGAASVTLNRVIGYGSGPGASTIAGSLTANGHVFLINPAGITFAGGAQVNVGSLVASTLDISDANFLAGVASGQYVFEPMTAAGNQIVQVDAGAQITAAAAGTVALLGRQVSNSGSIAAPGGSVLFGSAERITLDFQGDGLTMLTIQGPGIAKPGSVGCPALPCPGPVLPQLANFGTVTADGGQILMRTAATASATGGAIINAGLLRAQSLVSRNGRVELTSEGGPVALGLPSPAGSAGVIDVSGQAGASGGSVRIRGSDFLMFNDDPNPLNPDPASNGSVILAAGDIDGGQVDIQVDNLARIYSLSAIVADGSAGNGGQVTVSAATLELGAQAGISASGKGGAGGSIALLGGSGGMALFGTLAARGATAGGAIAISTSADSFDFRGLRVDAGSPLAAGSWTLSLPDVTVIAGSDAGELDAITGGAYLQDAELNAAFANNTRITLNSADSVLFDDAQIIAGGSVPLAFAVNAQRAITGSGFSIIGRTGPLEMRFNADAGAAHAGDGWIDFSNAVLDSNGGDLLLYGQSDQANGYASGTASGIRLYGVTVASGGGDVLLRGASTGDAAGAGDAGVSLEQVPIDAGSGQLSIVGRGAQGAGGVWIRGDFADIAAGGVDILGRASGSGNGVDIYDVGITTSGGDLSIDGEGGGRGVYWRDDAGGLYANGGDVRIHGVGDGDDGVVLIGNLDSGGGAIAIDGQGGQGSGVVFRSSYSGGMASGGGDIDLTGTGYVNGVALIGFGYGNNRLDSGGGMVRIDGRSSGLDGSGVVLSSMQVLAGAGDIHLTGLGPQAEGVRLSDDSLLQTTSGDIDLVSVGYNLGFGLYGAQILTDTGNLSLHARGLGADSDGLVIGQYASLVSNGGIIDLAGEGGSGAGLRIDALAAVDAGSGLVVLRAGNDGSSDAIRIDGSVYSSAGVNLRPGGVDANGLAYDRTADGILLGSGTGFALDDAELDRVVAPQLVIGSQQHAGAIQVQQAMTHAGNLTLQNEGGAGGIALQAGVDVGSGTLALLSGGSISQTAAGAIVAHSLLARAAGDVLLGTALNDLVSTSLAGSAGGTFQFQDASGLAIGPVSAAGFDAGSGSLTSVGNAGISAGGNVLVRNLAGDLILNAGVSGADIDLVTAGTLQNLAGVSLAASGHWRVWASTWVGETRGGLSGSGDLPNYYGCAYLGACGVTVSGGDNHFIYVQQPTAFITIGDATREYGLPNPVFGYGVSGLILGDLAANAIAGGPITAATPGSNVGNYAITGNFTSPAGYAIQWLPGTLAITPATLVFSADPFVRFYGMPNPFFTGTITGFRNGDTVQSVFGTASPWYSPAGIFAAPGIYPIFGVGSAQNYVIVQAPGNATALRVLEPFAPDRPIDIVGDPPNTYLYDRNFAGAPACAVNASLSDEGLAAAGDTLANEWSKVRTRPNLVNCFDSEQRSRCGDF